MKASRECGHGQPSATSPSSSSPPQIAHRMRGQIARAMTAPETHEAFERGGMVVPARTSLEDPKAWLRNEMASWKRDVEDVGIVVEE